MTPPRSHSGSANSLRMFRMEISSSTSPAILAKRWSRVENDFVDHNPR
jgi:hypothetical protein